MTFDYVIVGGGISGLYAAYLLNKSKQSFCLIESRSELGGTWKSIPYKNSLFELGPNTIVDSSIDLQELIDDLVLDEEILKTPLAKSKRYIFDDNKLIELKANPFALMLSGLISPKGFLEIFKEPFNKKLSNEEESVRDFAIRKFGTEPTHKLIETFLKGVWAGDPEKLSSEFALKFLVELENEYGSIFSGFFSQILAKKEKKKTKSIISFRHGLQFLTSKIAEQLDKAFLKLNHEVHSIEREGNDYVLNIKDRDEQLKAKKVIFANKAYEAAGLLENLAPDLSKTLSSIYYAPIALFAYSLPKNKFKRSLDGFGYLSADNNYETLGTIWASELFPERNLENEYICLSFIGGAKNSKIIEKSDDLIWAKIVEEQLKVYQGWTNGDLKAGDFRLIASKKIVKAIPQLNIGHREILRELKELSSSKSTDFLFTGNYITGVSIKDTLACSKACSI